MAERVGSKAREQLARMGRVWRQGQHVLISGATGSGKTVLARHIDQMRITRGGHVVVFVCKLTPDPTIKQEYKGWTVWRKWKKYPAPHENKILLIPDTKGMPAREAVKVQRAVFADAIDGITQTGHWTVHFDEGLYMCSPSAMNMSHDLALLHQMGRSSNISVITLTQRPSHLPLVLYSSASHAFVGRAREATDVKRLAELGGRENARELAARIESQGRHDFLWIPSAVDWEAEPINLRN
jgi:energy-coupling factor transporter ATP-binding protein EcfA2